MDRNLKQWNETKRWTESLKEDGSYNNSKHLRNPCKKYDNKIRPQRFENLNSSKAVRLFIHIYVI